jgi:hypothetical protein
MKQIRDTLEEVGFALEHATSELSRFVLTDYLEPYKAASVKLDILIAHLSAVPAQDLKVALFLLKADCLTQIEQFKYGHDAAKAVEQIDLRKYLELAAVPNHIPDVGKMVQPITDTDSAREYLVENLLPKFSDSTFAYYVRNELAGDFAYQLAKYLQAQQPAQEPDYNDIQLAEMIMSDCGMSTMNSQSLVDRIANRIAKHVAQEPVKQEPYAYDVPTEDGTELAYAIYFTKYGRTIPAGAIPLYMEKD